MVIGSGWSKRLLGHGGSGTVAGVTPVADEAAARRRGQPQSVALLGCIADLYKGMSQAIDAGEFTSREQFCGWLLRPFGWLAPAVRRAAAESGLAEVARFRRLFETSAEPVGEPSHRLLRSQPQPARRPRSGGREAPRGVRRSRSRRSLS